MPDFVAGKKCSVCWRSCAMTFAKVNEKAQDNLLVLIGNLMVASARCVDNQTKQ